MHYGEGTFLRVELCQRPSYSLHAAVSITASKPSDNEILTCRGFHLVKRLALAHHKAPLPVEKIGLQVLLDSMAMPLTNTLDLNPVDWLVVISIQR